MRSRNSLTWDMFRNVPQDKDTDPLGFMPFSVTLIPPTLCFSVFLIVRIPPDCHHMGGSDSQRIASKLDLADGLSLGRKELTFVIAASVRKKGTVRE